MRRQKILAIVAACLVATSCPGVVMAGEITQQEAANAVYGASENVVYSGDCSATAEDNVKWRLVQKEDGTYKLIITGSGKMCNGDSFGIFNYYEIDRYEITEIEIQEGVVSIGDQVFMNCVNLQSVSLPQSLRIIGTLAFDNCYIGLRELTIPEGVNSIGSGAFAGCENLEKIDIPDGVSVIEDSLFCGCINLKRISMPKGVKSIGGSAFSDCKKLEEITIPENVKSIGLQAFYDCGGLKELSIPEGVKDIYCNAWDHCENLKKINLPHSIEKIYASGNGFMSLYYDFKPAFASGNTELSDIYYNGTSDEWKTIHKYIARMVKQPEGIYYVQDGWNETDKDFINEGVTIHFLEPAKPTSSPTPKPTSTVKPAATATPTPTAAPGKEKAVTMYRLYNALNKEHFYTASTHEKDVLVTRGWKYEGVGWYAPEKSNTPVYRLYNPFVRDHHYTTDANEKNVLSSKYGWIYEGIGWYSDDSKGVPLYRRYCPILKSGSHHYTTALNEAKHLVSVGWKDEGIAWYGLKTEKK